MKKLLVLVLSVVSYGSMVLAAPVNSKIIPDDAKVVFHADFDAFRSSPYMDILSELKDSDENPMKEVTEKLGFDPSKEMASVTVYSDAFEPDMEGKGVFIIQTLGEVLKPDSIINMIKEESSGEDVDIKSTMKNSNKIYTLTKGENSEEKIEFCFLDGKTVVVAGNDDITKATKTISSKSGKYSDMSVVPAGSILSINISELDLGNVAANNPQVQMVKDVNSVSCFIGETAGNTFITAKLSVTDSTAAQALQGQVNGMLQFLVMSAASQSPEMMQYAQNIKVLADGDAVNISFQCPSESIVNIVKAKMAESQAGPMISIE